MSVATLATINFLIDWLIDWRHFRVVCWRTWRQRWPRCSPSYRASRGSALSCAYMHGTTSASAAPVPSTTRRRKLKRKLRFETSPKISIWKTYRLSNCGAGCWQTDGRSILTRTAWLTYMHVVIIWSYVNGDLLQCSKTHGVFGVGPRCRPLVTKMRFRWYPSFDRLVFLTCLLISGHHQSDVPNGTRGTDT